MTTRTIKSPKNYEVTAWKWMRYSSILLIPLVWFHVLLQDVIVGVHEIDLGYVVERWSNLGIQLYDIALLAFAFAHGMNGLRQVAMDFIHTEKARKTVSWLIFILWVIVSAMGGIAIVAAAQKNLAGM